MIIWNSWSWKSIEVFSTLIHNNINYDNLITLTKNDFSYEKDWTHYSIFNIWVWDFFYNIKDLKWKTIIIDEYDKLREDFWKIELFDNIIIDIIKNNLLIITTYTKNIWNLISLFDIKELKDKKSKI